MQVTAILKIFMKTGTYTDTKYKDVPVVQMKYKYKMMKWVAVKPFEFNGTTKKTSFSAKEQELKKFTDTYRNIQTD